MERLKMYRDIINNKIKWDPLHVDDGPKYVNRRKCWEILK